MFLETYDGYPASLLNPIQGLYEVMDGHLISHINNEVKFELEDLNKLQEK